MIIECLTMLAETLVCQVLRQHGADFQRRPLPSSDVWAVLDIQTPLPAAAYHTLEYFARNTYGIRMRPPHRAAGEGELTLTAYDIAAPSGDAAS